VRVRQTDILTDRHKAVTWPLAITPPPGTRADARPTHPEAPWSESPRLSVARRQGARSALRMRTQSALRLRSDCAPSATRPKSAPALSAQLQFGRIIAIIVQGARNERGRAQEAGLRRFPQRFAAHQKAKYSESNARTPGNVSISVSGDGVGDKGAYVRTVHKAVKGLPRTRSRSGRNTPSRRRSLENKMLYTIVSPGRAPGGEVFRVAACLGPRPRTPAPARHRLGVFRVSHTPLLSRQHCIPCRVDPAPSEILRKVETPLGHIPGRQSHVPFPGVIKITGLHPLAASLYISPSSIFLSLCLLIFIILLLSFASRIGERRDWDDERRFATENKTARVMIIGRIIGSTVDLVPHRQPASKPTLLRIRDLAVVLLVLPLPNGSAVFPTPER
jgi:hypothetical protein